ncbi:MAG: hypothetical protein CL908_17420 [Deltaproteobacteria bacterium]|nr:hypothetical protein [Deltaproteobacteria bacterium]
MPLRIGRSGRISCEISSNLGQRRRPMGSLARVWKTVWIYPHFRSKSKFLNDSAIWITLRT